MLRKLRDLIGQKNHVIAVQPPLVMHIEIIVASRAQKRLLFDVDMFGSRSKFHKLHEEFKEKVLLN